MHDLRHFHRIGRLMAVWLLLWFVAMAAAPLKPLAALADAPSLTSVESEAGGDDCPHAEHAHAGDHEAHEEHGHDPADLHAGHASGSLSHCPLCLHAAAPPPSLFATCLFNEAPQEPPSPGRLSHVPTRTDTAPLPRGPPVFS